MTSKIDVRLIVMDHFATFRDEGTGNVSWLDYGIMVALPVAIGVAAWFLGFEIKDQYIGTLVSVFAIFAGLLFNVLILIYSFSDANADGRKSLRDKLLTQSFANISYAILASLLIVVILAALVFFSGGLQRFLGALAVVVATNFLLSLLMVLKRIHVLLRDKFGG
jgi:hypothetical protein